MRHTRVIERERKNVSVLGECLVGTDAIVMLPEATCVDSNNDIASLIVLSLCSCLDR